MKNQIRKGTFRTLSINKGEALVNEYTNYCRYDPCLTPLKNLSDNENLTDNENLSENLFDNETYALLTQIKEFCIKISNEFSA